MVRLSVLVLSLLLAVNAFADDMEEVTSREGIVFLNNQMDSTEHDSSEAAILSMTEGGYTVTTKIFEPEPSWGFERFDIWPTCIDIELDPHGVRAVKIHDRAGVKPLGKVQVQATFLSQTASEFPLKLEGRLLNYGDISGEIGGKEPAYHWATNVASNAWLQAWDAFNPTESVVDVDDQLPPPPDPLVLSIAGEGEGKVAFKMVKGVGTYDWSITKEGDEEPLWSSTVSGDATVEHSNIPAGRYILKMQQQMGEEGTLIRAIPLVVGGLIVCPQAKDFTDGLVSGRILISRQHTGDDDPGYHTTYQQEDRKVVIEAKRKVGPDYAGDPQPISFRIIDPDDPSVHDENDEKDDNRDTSDEIKKKGFLTVASGFTEVASLSPQGLKIGMTVTSKIENEWETAKVVLTITDHCAGDNYIVKARFGTDFPNDPLEGQADDSSPHTCLLTAWKRIYYEIGCMAKAGADVQQVNQQARQITLKEQPPGWMEAGTKILLFSNESNEHRAGQILTLTALADKIITVSENITQAYTVSSDATQNHPYGTTVHVAMVTEDVVPTWGATDDMRVQLSLDAAFLPLFIEHYQLHVPHYLMPYREYFFGNRLWQSNDITRMSMVEDARKFSQQWFTHAERREDNLYVEPPAPPAQHPRGMAWTGKKNTIHLVFGHKFNEAMETDGIGVYPCNAAYVFRREGFRNWVTNVLPHECGHQYDPWNNTGGAFNHCTGVICLMSSNSFTSSLTKMCKEHAVDGRLDGKWPGKRVANDGL